MKDFLEWVTFEITPQDDASVFNKLLWIMCSWLLTFVNIGILSYVITSGIRIGLSGY